MKVLLLSNRSDLLATPLTKAGDRFVVSTTAPDTWPEADFVVSFGELGSEGVALGLH